MLLCGYSEERSRRTLSGSEGRRLEDQSGLKGLSSWKGAGSDGSWRGPTGLWKTSGRAWKASFRKASLASSPVYLAWRLQQCNPYGPGPGVDPKGRAKLGDVWLLALGKEVPEILRNLAGYVGRGAVHDRQRL